MIICQGGSGSIVSTNNCIDNFVIPFVQNTIYGGWLPSGDPTAAVPSGAVNTGTCAFGGPTRTYSVTEFQVSLTGNYIFEMVDNATYNGVGYIYTGNFTPGSCASGTLIRADSDGGSGNEPRLGGAGGDGPMNLTAGVTYYLVSSTEGGADVTGNTFTWNISPPVGGDVMFNEPGTVEWYTVPSGGSPIASGGVFNPVGVPGSGLANTNSSGTWTYYAACSSSPSCRTSVDYQVTATTTLYNVTPAGASCYDPASPVDIGLSGSQNGMTYRLMRDGVSTGNEVVGTGSPIALVGATSVAGVYTVVAVIGPSCLIPMNGSLEIEPSPIADAGSDATLCDPTLDLSATSDPNVIATKDFGNANTELTNTTSDWRVHYLYGSHPANRTQWHLGYSGGAPFSFGCATTGSALVLMDNRLPFQTAVPCDYAWDNGVMDEIAYRTAPIDARLYTTVNVSFDYRIGGNFTGGVVRDYMQVMYSMDNGATWTAVSAGNNAGSYTMLRQLNGTTNAFFSTTGTTQVGTANVTMPAPIAGEFFLLGFRWTNDGSMAGDYVDNMLVDNIVVSGTPSFSWSPTTGVSNANTATPTVTIPGTYTVTVTAGNGCSSTDDVEVLPRPEITSILATTVCSGTAFSFTPVDGMDGVIPVGTTYAWSAPSVAGISGAAAGSGASSIAGTLTNNTNAPINVVYTITPTGNGCTADPFNVTVTVDPRPDISNMTASGCTGAGFSVTPVNATDGIVPSGTTYTWAAPSVTGGMTGGAASSGTPASIAGNLVNPTNSTQTATYTVTATSGSCVANSTFDVVVTVNPAPAITAMTASACGGASFSVTPANGTNGVVPASTTYSWSAPSVAGITGTAAGTDESSVDGTLINTTSSPINVVYNVTPSTGGCPGSDFTVTVTVNPGPSITNMTSTVCSADGFTVTPVDVTNGVVPSGTTYAWSAPVVTGGITGGAAGSGAANISGTLTNPSNSAQTATYTVTATIGSCVASSPFTVIVTVNPRPAVTAMTTAACSGAAFTVTPVNSTDGIVPAGTTYSWSAPTVGGGMTGGAAGSGSSSISGTLINPTTSDQNAVYNVTPTAGGCGGSSFTVTATINPSVTVPSVITFTGAEPTCQLTVAGSTTDYNSTTTVGVLEWSLTGISNASGTLPTSAIDASTGVVTWPNGWSGSVTVNAVSTGCNGPSSAATRTVTVTQTVGLPTAISVASGFDPPCQLTNGTNTTTYATTASGSTGFTWSLSNSSAGTIDPTTGVMTWANGFAGSVNIQVTAAGCNGPSTMVVRTVDVLPTVGTPTAIVADVEPVCQLTNGTTVTNYSTTASNNTGLNWSISNPAAGSISGTGVMTWANGFYGTVEIRVTASGCNGPSIEVTRTVVIGPGQINPPFRTWTGLENSLWQVDGNWDCGGVPTAADRVLIPASPIGGNTPVIQNGITGWCLDIEIQSVAAPLLEIQNGGELRVTQ